MSVDEDLGKEAYDAYYTKCGAVGLFSGTQLPVWLELDPEIRATWMASAHAVYRKIKRDGL